MTYQRLKILFDIFLSPDENEEDIRSKFLMRGEDPDAVIDRVNFFLKKKEAEINLEIGREKQKKAGDFLKGLAVNTGIIKEDDHSLNDLGFAYRKQSSAEDNQEELKIQKEKINNIKNFLGNGDEHTGKS
ncbi:MAG: hypothetical protein M1480_06245 [Bacteroidetes bacterium]|nr:hypothetical protein [Bacteroidota bacterium]